MTSQPQSEILYYFQELLESNKLTFLKNEAITKIQELYGSQVESVDQKKGIIKYVKVYSNQSSDEPIEAIATYSFAKEFPKEVKNQAGIAKIRVDETVLEINKAGNNANQFLVSRVKHLRLLVEKSRDVYPKLRFIEGTLLELLDYLVDKYSLNESYKKQSNIDINDISFFDIKSTTKRTQLVKVYDTAIDLEIFDDEKVSEDTFINILSGNPSKTAEVLTFKCNNQLIAHFINSLQPLFNNLTQAQIGKSGCFVNKQGKILSQQDLYTANTRLKSYSSQKLDKITNALSNIINT